VGSFAASQRAALAQLVGIVTGIFGLIGMCRNVTPTVEGLAAVNNYLLPAWMIGLGVWLVLVSRKTGRSTGNA
jgi:hypothetical protein